MKPLPEERIYLDHNATTPIDPAAVEAMRRVMEEEFGNPSRSFHDEKWILLSEVMNAGSNPIHVDSRSCFPCAS